ncbi:MAG: hypothetical protein ABI091_12240 [Ferruginibacter sp.]
MKTIMAKFTKDTTLLILGVKGKISEDGQITDSKTNAALIEFVNAFKTLIANG